MGHLRSMLKDREEDPINQHNESQISPEPVRKKQDAARWGRTHSEIKINC